MLGSGKYGFTMEEQTIVNDTLEKFRYTGEFGYRTVVGNHTLAALFMNGDDE